MELRLAFDLQQPAVESDGHPDVTFMLRRSDYTESPRAQFASGRFVWAANALGRLKGANSARGGIPLDITLAELIAP